MTTIWVMETIFSPNTVIAKYISDTIDILRPRIETKRPEQIIFYVGTNINGVLHIGILIQNYYKDYLYWINFF
jgi:hypothetical protein